MGIIVATPDGGRHIEDVLGTVAQRRVYCAAALKDLMLAPESYKARKRAQKEWERLDQALGQVVGE
jgi:hypothetical protein